MIRPVPPPVDLEEEAPGDPAATIVSGVQLALKEGTHC